MVLTIQIAVYFPIYKVDFPANLLIFLEALRKIAEGKVIDFKKHIREHIIAVVIS